MELPISYPLTRRDLVKMAVAFVIIPGEAGFASRPRKASMRPKPFQSEDRFSPLNKKRPRRPYTRYIVLHTTEGEEEGSLR